MSTDPTPSSPALPARVAGLLRREAVGGTLALLAAAVAVLWANLAGSGYAALRGTRIGPLDLEHWAADGALALFFFVAGLEVKRELALGSLRRPADAAVPIAAAVAGIAVPAAVFAVLNLGTGNLRGWAIPGATDIAFALAVLAVVGRHLPGQLRAFLLTLAVVDDVVVIAIIAVFYSGSVQPGWLGAAVVGLAAYAVLQRLRVRTWVVYLPLAAGVWWAVHESGVHATVAGVLLGLLTRVLPDPGEEQAPAARLEHRLTPLSSGLAVPFFALLSAGVVLGGGLVPPGPVVLGVVLGLVLGKPVGVLGGAWLVTRLTRARLDPGLGWPDLAGVGLLAGVGFTVSLLVSDLSFTDARRDEAKAAVLVASVVSATLAGVVLSHRDRAHRRAPR